MAHPKKGSAAAKAWGEKMKRARAASSFSPKARAKTDKAASKPKAARRSRRLGGHGFGYRGATGRKPSAASKAKMKAGYKKWLAAGKPSKKTRKMPKALLLKRARRLEALAKSR